MSESNAFVKFSEEFVKVYRVASNETETQRLKQAVEEPRKFNEFYEVLLTLFTATDNQRLPPMLQWALEQPGTFASFAEAFVHFFVKLTGDDALPRDLERLAKEGRELSERIEGAVDPAGIEKRVNESEATLRRLQQQIERSRVLDTEQMIIARVNDEVQLFRRRYRDILQLGREIQEGFVSLQQEYRDMYREMGMPIPHELLEAGPPADAMEEDVEFIQAHEALTKERAAYQLGTIRTSVSSVTRLLDEYARRKRKRTFYRLGFGLLLILIAVVVFLTSQWTERTPQDSTVRATAVLLFGLLTAVVYPELIKPWLDKRKGAQRISHTKASIAEFYPVAVRVRLYLAFAQKYLTHSPATRAG